MAGQHASTNAFRAMKTFLSAVNLKLGLIVFAVGIAVASLLYTQGLVNRLRERESANMAVWAGAREEVARAAVANPFQGEFQALDGRLDPALPDTPRLRTALEWARNMPVEGHLDFVYDIVRNYYTDVPAVIADSLGQPISWHNINVPDTVELSARDSQLVRRRIARMAAEYDPIPIEVIYDDPAQALRQRVYYGESSIIRELRIYPYLQLFFVGLFIVVGYLGFSYLRRNEQSNLWVGMAREAAHQLGTPISSLMGWVEIMRSEPGADQVTLTEMDHDIRRLSLVAKRFNAIGSLPRLELQPLGPVIAGTAEYIRRRMPERGVTLSIDVQEDYVAPINTELFAWVIENLLKNALDALLNGEGQISVSARREGAVYLIDVEDSGRGIDRRHWKDIFRPGFTTRTRGWGLGLSLAKRVIEDYHGGSLILLQSGPSRGSVFRITLPMILHRR